MGTGGVWESDSALIAAVGSRDHEAFGEIYRRHGAVVWSVANQMCRSAELAEDVCERVFSELWSHPERFDPVRGALRSWLVAQAHARAVAAGRAGGTRPPEERPLSDAAQRAVDQLAADERDCILLTYVGGHGCGETARLLGMSERMVKSSLRRGLLNVRRALEGEGVSR